MTIDAVGQRRAARLLGEAREAAAASRHDEVPGLLAAARAEINDGELGSLARRYCELFGLPAVAELDLRGEVAWLDDAAGAELDALRRDLIGAYRARGGEWTGVAMEQAYLLEPTDAHRQVFADWLMSRADPRGEFMALQLAYAQNGLERNGRARMERLLRENIEDWGAPFVQRDAAILVFRLGFPSVVDQREATVAALSELGVHWRTVRRVLGRDAPQLRGCRHLRRARAPWSE